MMDGRDFGPHRSVHVPPPLLTGLAMESHRLGAATAAGRIASSPSHLATGHPTPLHTGKYMSSAMNLHSLHGDSFPGSSSPFLSGYLTSGLGGSSTPHGTPTSLPAEPSFRAPTPSNLQMAQLWASHPHEGFSHLPNSLYPSPYIPLSHLEHQSSGSAILSQLSQHGLYESQKEGFYLSGRAGQSALHPQTTISRATSNQMPSSLLREKDTVSHHKSAKDWNRESSREKPYRTDLNLSHPRRERERHREEPRPRSVVDLTQDTKLEGSERKVSGLDRPYKTGEHTSLFYREHSPGLGGGEPKSKNPLQTSSLSNCNSGGSSSSVRYQGSEQERCAKDPSRHDENMRPSAYVHVDKPKKCDAVVTTSSSSVGSLHISCSCPSTHSNAPQPAPRVLSSNTFPPTHHAQASLYPLYPSAKEPAREHKVIAPTFVPSVEVYERNGPIQIASQARDNKNDKNRDKDGNKPGCLQALSERTLVDPLRPPHAHESPLHGDVKRMEVFREEGSVIMSNCVTTKRPTSSELFPVKAGHSPDTRDLLLNSTTSKEMMKMVMDAEARSQERERLQRAAARDSSKLYSELKNSSLTEPKWKPFEMGSYATNHMAALAAQHGHVNRGGEEEGKKAYLDPSSLQRSVVVGNSQGSSEVLHLGSRGEVSAMQSLIKYSGNFAKETSARPNGGIRSPFGGLGNMKLESNPLGMSKVQHLPPQQCGKQLKRDPERPESAKSFGRESIGSQGEVEVRHPPVGIAVAVARQKDNTSKPSSNLGDRERSIPVGSIKGSGHGEADRTDDRSHHHDERLLAGRLEREQEKLLRESKELADFARIHQPGVSSNGLNPNLMVTGGPSLAGPGRWSADPASHLASHHWIPRTDSSSLWLAGSPYGLGHPSLHQGMAPAYHPGMPGSIPSPYQFARDPQSGQLLVIPTDHLPHFAELMERAPPLWSTMYPPAGSSLQHAHQLQLLSHQQLLRQHELYMLQHQAAQAMEIRRSAQLVERLKASEHRAEMEDKAAKRSHEGAKQGLPAACAPALQSRKPPLPSPTPSTSYGKALTPRPPTPSLSPVTALKSEVLHKMEEAVPQQPYSHPSTPAPHPSSPAPASPPPKPPILTKEEAPEEMEKKEIGLQKGPCQALFPEIPQGYSFQSITAPFGSHYPYLLQPAAASDADGLAPDVPLPAETSEHLSASVEVKPMRLHPPAMVESLQSAMGPEPMEENAVNKVESDLEETQSPGDQNGSTVLTKSVPEELQMPTEPDNQSGTERHTDEVEEEQEDKELQKGGGTAQICQISYRLIDCAPEMEPQPEKPKIQAHSVHADFDNSMAYCGPEVQEVQIQRESSSKAEELYDEANEKETFAVPSSTTEPPTEDLSIKEGLLSSQIAQLDTLNIRLDDPMAGMIALVAASELPQTCFLPTHYTPTAVLSAPEMTDCSPVDPAGLQGIALLSEIAELELERRKNEIHYTMRADLESLLVAGTQVLMEALACKPAITIRLPRELNPNKKYSWMQKKDEPMFYIKSAIEDMGAMELDYRVRLAELQRRYKDKQRELAKLQKRKDAEEKHEEKNRSLARRGPGRPRKRKHGLASLPVGKSDCKGSKLGKSFLLSEDTEMGEGLRKRFRGLSAEDDDEMDGVSAKVKRKTKSWDDASSSFSQEMHTKSKKKEEESEQEQLATKLDKTLSLTKLGQLGKSHFKFADGSVGKSSSSFGSYSKRFGSHGMEFLAKEGKKNLSQSLSISQKSSKEGKNKMAAKTKKMEFGMKVKGHLKASPSPARSEVSSYSYNTDTEEGDESVKHGWPSHSALRKSGLRGQPSRLHGSASTKSRQPPKRGLSTSSSSSAGTLKSKQMASKKRHKHFALLLQEAEARSSFSDSSEDSFDQGY